jgi:hypothetical protein
MEDGRFAVVKKNPDGSHANIYEGKQSNNLYFVDVKFIRPPGKQPVERALFTKVVETMDLWHHRMGHIGEAATKSPLKSVKGVTFPLGDKLSKCEPCIIGKHACAPHPTSPTPKSTELLELMFCDLCGPFPVLTPHRKLYLVAFLEDSVNILKLHCLAWKDQSAEAFQMTRASWERKTAEKLKYFCVNGAGELGSDDFVKALEGMGIEHDVVPQYEHWKNGKMERVFRTIQGRMLAMLTAAQLPLTYWGEAALTAGFLLNLTISSTLPKDVTPFELMKNAKPDVSHLKVWGMQCFAHIPVELQMKLGAKSCECLFMGYPPSGQGYRIRSLTTNHFFDSGNVIFDKNISYHAIHEVSSMLVNYSPLPFPATILNNIAPVTPPLEELDIAGNEVAPPPAPHGVVIAPSTSSHPVLHTERKLTPGGISHMQSIQAAKAHPERLCANAERRKQVREAGQRWDE